MLHIRTFRAPDDKEACSKFITGHKRLLEIYGITQITSNTQEWVDDEDTIVILVEDKETKAVFGGARVQIAKGNYPLPIESAIGKYDPKIYDMIKADQAGGGVYELCGLWNSREVAGMGIGSYILARIAVTIATQLPVKTSWVLCAPVTVKMATRLGYIIEKSLGNDGLFYYPKEDLVATAMRLPDINDLALASENERTRMLSLRGTPHQTYEEVGPKGTYALEYNIGIPNIKL
ncbi:hypothetical protein [Pedobacter sp. L105]|uniref:hypothetical protein n=1 Tax=Pedobacter sp. L105 TaxID=1641871 RepID=UPI00131D8294|nr:hypothetical protein [Pedobacter sp. L105]